MIEKNKKTSVQKIKTWWHNLPHKWFLLFQLLLPIPLLMINDMPIVIDILVFQYFFILYYYSVKTFCICLASQVIIYSLPALIHPVFEPFCLSFFCPANTGCYYEYYSFRCGNLLMIICTVLFFLAPIIIQLWRSNKHGRK